jgi:hypothetical protein
MPGHPAGKRRLEARFAVRCNGRLPRRERLREIPSPLDRSKILFLIWINYQCRYACDRFREGRSLISESRTSLVTRSLSMQLANLSLSGALAALWETSTSADRIASSLVSGPVVFAALFTYRQACKDAPQSRGFFRHCLPSGIPSHKSARADLLFWLSRRLFMPLLVMPPLCRRSPPDTRPTPCWR